MVKIDPKIKQEIRKNIVTLVREKTKDRDKEDDIDTLYESQGNKESNNYLKNILYVAKTENIQLRHFDLNYFELSDVERDTMKFLKEQLEAGTITEEQYRDVLDKIQEDRLKELKKRFADKINKPKKDCR